MKLIKSFTLPLIWLCFFIVGISTHYQNYSIWDWIVILLVALAPLLIAIYNFKTVDEDKKIKFTFKKLRIAFWGYGVFSMIIAIIISVFTKQYDVIFLFILGLLYFIVRLSSPNKQPKIIKGRAQHIRGLPIPENTWCEISSLAESYNFKVNGSEYKLDKSSVILMDTLSTTQVKHEMKKSYSGALLGGITGSIVAGSIGAITGATAFGTKSKKTKKYTFYLAIVYADNNDTSNMETIVLKPPEFSLLNYRLLCEFRREAKERRKAKKGNS